MVSTAGKGSGRRTISTQPDSSAAAAPATDLGLIERRGRRGAGALPRRALADGVVERRRTKARGADVITPSGSRANMTRAPLVQQVEALQSPILTAQEHYRLERQRRADRLTGDLATLLEEAKAEYEAHINAPRPAGKGGRPRKKPVVVDDDDL